MKIIQSEGGPLIGLDRNLVHNWGGISGKNYFTSNSSNANDYDELCNILSENNRIPSNVGLLSSGAMIGILISIPDQTAVIEVDDDCVYIAQLEASDQDWSFSMINKKDFESVNYNEKSCIEFYSDRCDYMMFDASYRGVDVHEDCLEFKLQKGYYKMTDGYFTKNNIADLILYKIEKIRCSVPAFGGAG